MISNSQRIRRSMIKEIDSIEIIGPFDSNDPLVDSLMSQIIEEGKSGVALDLSKTSYITSPGVSCIVKALKKMQAGNGTLRIAGATPDMIELLKLAHIDKFIRLM